MLKKQQGKLVKLIRSLNKAEKKSFKLSAGLTKGDKTYLQLFNLIDKKGITDDHKLRDALKVSANNYAVTKIYLFDAIVNAIKQSSVDTNVHQKVRSMIQSVQLLNDKGLNDEAAKILDKAEKIAKEHETHQELLEILSWKRILGAYYYKEYTEAKHIYKEQHKILLQLDNTFALHSLFLGIVKFYHNNSVLRSEKDIEEANLVMQDALAIKQKGNLGFKAKVYLQRIISIHATLTGDIARGLKANREQAKLIEPKLIHNKQTQGYLDLYILCHVELQLLYFYSKQHKKGLENAEKLLSLREQTNFEGYKILTFTRAWIHRLLHSVYIKSIEEIRKTIDAFLIEYNKGNNNSDPREHLIVLFALSITFFSIGDNKNALKYLNELRTLPNSVLQSNITSDVSLLQLAIYFDIGNEESLSYAIRSVYRLLRNQNRYFKSEQFVFMLLKELLKTTSTLERNGIYKRYLKLFQSIENDPKEQGAFIFFDITAWLKSKIEGKCIAEVVK